MVSCILFLKQWAAHSVFTLPSWAGTRRCGITHLLFKHSGTYFHVGQSTRLLPHGFQEPHPSFSADLLIIQQLIISTWRSRCPGMWPRSSCVAMSAVPGQCLHHTSCSSSEHQPCVCDLWAVLPPQLPRGAEAILCDSTWFSGTFFAEEEIKTNRQTNKT